MRKKKGIKFLRRLIQPRFLKPPFSAEKRLLILKSNAKLLKNEKETNLERGFYKYSLNTF